MTSKRVATIHILRALWGGSGGGANCDNDRKWCTTLPWSLGIQLNQIIRTLPYVPQKWAFSFSIIDHLGLFCKLYLETINCAKNELDTMFLICFYWRMFLKTYSLVPNIRRASYIRHNLDFPRSSCIAIMFLSKRFGMSCIPPWFSTFPAYFIAGWCHCYIYGGMPCLLIHPGLWVKVQQFLYCTKVLEKSTACLLIQHVLY